MDGYYVSRSDLLTWLNDTLGTSYAKVEECSNGVAFLALMSMLADTGSLVPTHRIRTHASLDIDCVHNFKLLQDVFNKCGIEKTIEVDKLVKGNYQLNLELLQWIKRHCETKGMYGPPPTLNGPSTGSNPAHTKSHPHTPTSINTNLTSSSSTNNNNTVNNSALSTPKRGTNPTSSSNKQRAPSASNLHSRSAQRLAGAGSSQGTNSNNSTTSGVVIQRSRPLQMTTSPMRTYNNNSNNNTTTTTSTMYHSQQHHHDSSMQSFEVAPSSLMATNSSGNHSTQSSQARPIARSFSEMSSDLIAANRTRSPMRKAITAAPLQTSTSFHALLEAAQKHPPLMVPETASCSSSSPATRGGGPEQSDDAVNSTNLAVMERNFYYDKLRDIEQLLRDAHLVEMKSSVELAEEIKRIMYRSPLA